MKVFIPIRERSACWIAQSIRTTGTMKAQATFPNPGSYLRPGQFARVRVAVAERENAILVPARAIQELQGAKTVMVVDADNKVSLRTIKIGDKV